MVRSRSESGKPETHLVFFNHNPRKWSEAGQNQASLKHTWTHQALKWECIEESVRDENRSPRSTPKPLRITVQIIVSANYISQSFRLNSNLHESTITRICFNLCNSVNKIKIEKTIMRSWVLIYEISQFQCLPLLLCLELQACISSVLDRVFTTCLMSVGLNYVLLCQSPVNYLLTLKVSLNKKLHHFLD